MDKDLMTVANLFLSFERVQGKVWTLIGPREAKRLESLSHRQVKAMMEVAHRKMGGGEPYTLGELGDLLRIGKSAASLLVSGLVDQGLMTRTTDPKNRRFVRIDLSKAGQKLTATLSEHMQGIFARFLDGLPAGRRREFLSVAAELGAYLGKEGVS